MSIAEDFIPQFRRVAQERLDRVEIAWQAVLTNVDDTAAELIHREIHTLKGEARMLGFPEVHLVCHKLEDLLELARLRGYAIDDDFDLVVNMALRFLAMLVRKKAGAQLSGIDLPGFIRQIDAIVAEAKPATSDGLRYNASPRPAAQLRISAELRAHIANVAVDAFIEYAQAEGNRRTRLRSSWHAIRDLIALQRAVIGPPQLARHEASVRALARDLDKPVEVTMDVETAEVSAEILSAIDVALVHLVRNAMDHGIEPASARASAGKPSVGKIRITSGIRANTFVVAVEDDGGGIAFDRLYARAVELGVISAEPMQALDRARWIEIMCHPGLSSRTLASDLSGRGVGLHAVRATVVDVGGTLTMASTAGVGTTWTITIPVSMMTVPVHVFRAPGLPFPIAIDATWTVTDLDEGGPIIDLANHLGSPTPRTLPPGPPTCAWFVRGDARVGVVVDELPRPALARRLIVTSPTSAVELVTHEAVEGLLLRPERLRD